ncbi:hybrid cluster protein-associated redox disulfide domain protein (plasmid) [Phaeobacter inhibens]|uniref:Hybrid cluster protein-associated redox disulfide domain protein n=1 Tax=Phaeobacter inhibens TaxID=221822 RepID=A0ABM6RJU5_9RHOB|nr:hypothetical protein [Phaeobacter inhibens]AUQ52080.1 hybrid cluster protein-associated redox disulfide domain protein [Phaeobacter inhibens]AUQ96684.1 hybrid cluster protein-associated redox disulfide domain protein [Phaeobacter inhibens]AUR21885.1 hybrid cluster protein-associated redox disulfide domain protein [Phaeobacter inhibens]
MPPPKPDDPDLPLDVLMTIWPETVRVFMDHDMLCVGCMVSPFHSVSEACAEYHLDEEVFRAALAEAVEAAHRRWG